MLTTDFPGAYRLSLGQDNALQIIINRLEYERILDLYRRRPNNEPLGLIQTQAEECGGEFSLDSDHFGFDPELKKMFFDEKILVLKRTLSETINITASCSLYLLFFALNYEATSEPLIKIEINNRPDLYEHSLHAHISPALVSSLDQLYKYQIRKLIGVAQTIRDAQFQMDGYRQTQDLIRADLNEGGDIYLMVGNDCACFGGGRNSTHPDSGYTLSGHNIRFFSHQFSLLAGMAKLSDIHYECCENSELLERVARCNRHPSDHLPCYLSGGAGVYHICAGNYRPGERQLNLCLRRHKKATEDQTKPKRPIIETTLPLDI